MKLWLATAMLTLVACGGDVVSPAAPTDGEPAVLIGAGDIGVCGSTGAAATGRLLGREPGTVFAAGDIAYPEGTAEEFQKCYDPVWGHVKERTRPSPGNHEYGSPGAAPYFAYFGANAGPAGLGYYRYQKGSWPVFSLNSNAEGGAGMSQIAWLRTELQREAACSVAYFHHPRFSSGPHGLLPHATAAGDFWQALYAAGVDVVISGHEHFYERFAPQTPDGRLDLQYGIREFVVGTGGAPLTQPVRRVAHSEVVMSSFGVLRLTLDVQSYRWEFLAAETGGVLDSGTGLCHGRPGS
jgi:acid phosphatase type 7